jgi:hypothetical protein
MPKISPPIGCLSHRNRINLLTIAPLSAIVRSMKAYVWKDRIGVEYVVFADSVKEAKGFLRYRYDSKDLDNLLFCRKHVTRPMPKGLCNMNPASTVWFPKRGKAI